MATTAQKVAIPKFESFFNVPFGQYNGGNYSNSSHNSSKVYTFNNASSFNYSSSGNSNYTNLSNIYSSNWSYDPNMPAYNGSSSMQ